MLRIEYEDPVESGPCECCGGTTTSLTRFVYSDGDAYAVYYARFSDSHPGREVRAAVLWTVADVRPDSFISANFYGDGFIFQPATLNSSRPRPRQPNTPNERACLSGH